MGDETLNAIGTVGFLIAALASTAFTALYPVLAKFWKTRSGWHIFIFMAVITFILDHSALTLVVQDYPGREYVRAFSFPLLAAVLIWRLVILIRVQITRRESTEDYRVDQKR